MTLPKLPKLPAGFLVNAASHDERHKWIAYTEEEMKAYAEQYGRLCADAEREACALACEEFILNRPNDPPARHFDYALKTCATAIRARSTR